MVEWRFPVAMRCLELGRAEVDLSAEWAVVRRNGQERSPFVANDDTSSSFFSFFLGVVFFSLAE